MDGEELSQFKKLTHDKKFIDSGTGETIARWTVSPVKIFVLLLASIISLVIIYGFLFTGDTQNFFGNVVFYAVVICIAIAVLWVATQGVLKFRKLITGFILSFILILVFYWFLGVLFSFTGFMDFHMGGKSLWILITFLAGLGAKRIDGDLDRNDVGYGLLVMIVLIGANIPVVDGSGFLATLDRVIFDNISNMLSNIL